MFPYSGGHPATVAAIGGEVDIAATGLMEQAEFIRGKKVRPLINFSDKPVELRVMALFRPLQILCLK
jgi:tripartite-type tricarboxylate transporter receptor subunit TctC